MQEEQQQAFNLMVERLMPEQIVSVVWSPNMDLCAILYVNYMIDIYRISFKAQRVYQFVETDPIVHMQFSSDSTLFYYAKADQVVVMRAAANTRVISFDTSVTEFQVGNYEAYKPIEAKHNIDLKICPVQSTPSEIINRISFLKEFNSQLLITWNSADEIQGFLNSFQLLFKISSVGIVQVFPTKQYNELHVFTQKLEDFKLEIYDISILSKQAKAISTQGYLIGQVQELQALLNTSLLLITTQINEIVKLFNRNITQIIEDAYKSKSKQQNLGVSVNQEFLKFLRYGSCSPEIQMFLSKELNDTKILQRVDEKITASFSQIQDIIAESSMNVIDEILKHIAQLKGFVSNPLYDGIAIKDLDQIIQYYEALQNLLNDLKMESAETKLHIRNFFVWLNKNVIKNQGENETEIENTKAHLVKFQVDIKRLNLFLSDQNLFSLSNIQSYSNSNFGRNSTLLDIKGVSSKFKKQESRENQTTVNDAFAAMTQQFHETYFEYVGAQLPTRQTSNIEIEIPKTTISELTKLIDLCWKNSSQPFESHISSQISLIRSHSLPKPLATRNPFVKTFGDQKDYKIAYIVGEHEVQVIDIGETVQVHPIKRYSERVCELAFDNQNNLLVLVQDLSNDLTEQKPLYMLMKNDESYTIEANSVTNLATSQKGLVSLVCDDKKIHVLD